jgi:hypothetical protein
MRNQRNKRRSKGEKWEARSEWDVETRLQGSKIMSALQPAFHAYHKVERFLDWLFDTPLDIGEEALRAWRPDWTTERPAR